MNETLSVSPLHFCAGFCLLTAMLDPAPQKPLTKNERMAAVCFVVFLLTMFAVDVIHDFQPAKMSALFFLLWWPPLLALHEFGHALAARAVGWRVGQIVIGMGPLVKTCQLKGIPLELRALPLEGFVRSLPDRALKFPRRKDAFIYFAGPGIELALAGLLTMFLGPDTMFQRTPNLGIMALQSLALAATTGAVLNLIPMTVFVKDHEIPNDGMGILMACRKPLAYYEALAKLDFERTSAEGQSSCSI